MLRWRDLRNCRIDGTSGVPCHGMAYGFEVDGSGHELFQSMKLDMGKVQEAETEHGSFRTLNARHEISRCCVELHIGLAEE